jgi:predicted negative regulator of RcsB-dependent stress response
LDVLSKAKVDGQTRAHALACEYLGEFSLGEQRLRSASLWLRRAIQLAEPRGLRDIVGEATCRLAELDLALQHPEDALARVETCLADFESMNDVYEVAVCRRVRGQALLALGRADEARIDFEKALEFFDSVGEQFESLRVRRLLQAAAHSSSWSSRPSVGVPCMAMRSTNGSRSAPVTR